MNTITSQKIEKVAKFMAQNDRIDADFMNFTQSVLKASKELNLPLHFNTIKKNEELIKSLILEELGNEAEQFDAAQKQIAKIELVYTDGSTETIFQLPQQKPQPVYTSEGTGLFIYKRKNGKIDEIYISDKSTRFAGINIMNFEDVITQWPQRAPEVYKSPVDSAISWCQYQQSPELLMRVKDHKFKSQDFQTLQRFEAFLKRHKRNQF